MSMFPTSATPIDMRRTIAFTLRLGVMLACLIAAVGGALYLLKHGGEPMPDYTHFSYTAAPPPEYTTLSGILSGVCHFTAMGWIQLGVVVLLLTPIVRVVLSLIEFALQRDRLYTAITAAVLLVILCNSLGGF